MSTPFSSSIMSGSFDFPPASNGTDSPEGSHRPTFIDPRSTHLDYNVRETDLTQLERDDFERRRRAFDFHSRHSSSLHGGTRRQHHEDRAAANQNFPTSAIRPRVLGSRIRRRLANNAHSPARSSVHIDSFSGVDLPEPTLPRADLATAEYSGEAEVNRRRKRCKLDEDRLNRGSKVFSYEWKGQVVPGPLKMEIHACDGGLHSDVAAQDRQQYRRENMLRNDKSVYCTDRAHCNIILRHVGEACFSLKKLVIKAPESGFTAPSIQEGMIFVSMTHKDLLVRTSPYHLHCESESDCDSDEGSLDHATSPSAVRPVSRRRDSMARAVPPPISDSMYRTVYRGPWRITEPYPTTPLQASSGNDALQSTPSRQNTAMLSLHRRDSSETTTIANQGFAVTTHCNDPSEDEEEESSPQTLADRYQREHMPNAFSPTSEDDAEEALRQDSRVRRLGLSPSQLQNHRRRGTRRTSPSKFEVVKDEDCKVPVEDILSPHAEFFIDKDKSVISVCFEPPVSGKYILLKLWSPSNHNIDIQSIIAHGFAGPRLFPATEML